MKKTSKEKVETVVETVNEVKIEKRGRKASPTSARQIRLAGYKAKMESGVEVKRGRPTGSKQKVKQLLKINRLNIDPDVNNKLIQAE